MSFTSKKIEQHRRLLFSTTKLNRGYCFVTFASEDDAKRALINMKEVIDVTNKAKACLKLDTTHAEWDTELYEEHMDTYRATKKDGKDALISQYEELKTEEEKAKQRQKYVKDIMGDRTLDFYEQAQAQKSNTSELQMTPEEMRHHYGEVEYSKATGKPVRGLDQNQVFQSMKDQYFSNRDTLEPTIQDPSSRHQVGRENKKKTTQSDINELYRIIEGRWGMQFDMY